MSKKIDEPFVHEVTQSDTPKEVALQTGWAKKVAKTDTLKFGGEYPPNFPWEDNAWFKGVTWLESEPHHTTDTSAVFNVDWQGQTYSFWVSHKDLVWRVDREAARGPLKGKTMDIMRERVKISGGRTFLQYYIKWKD